MFTMASFFCSTLMIVMIVSLQMHRSSSCIESERKGLLELKAYYNNNFRYNWPNETDSDCCRWEGLKCDLTSGRVISLSPSHIYNQYPPVGLLPLNLSLFHPFGELQNLNLTSFQCAYWFDDIHGYKSLGRLKKLEVLDISYSDVNNSVLPFLSAASSLKTLVLRANNMGGIFPNKELENLRNLQRLDLSKNSFTGQLLGLENFHKLQSLDLSDNELSGVLENTGLCQLKNLQELDLSQNQFIGQFPQCFDNLTQLRVIEISSNQLNGTIPSFISDMDSIEYLSLSDNKFEGFSVGLMANLSKLKVLKLQNCNLEKIPSFLQHEKELHLINLSHNKLTGSFPSWLLVQNPKLEVLLLQNNSFTNFQLSGRLLVHSLQALDLSANEFDGEIPKNIGNIFPNLRHLNLSNNGFHGNLPPSLEEMNMLYYLDLSHNNFSGNLPREFLVGCYSLRSLKLSYNKFTGHIFSEAANLTSLEQLIADNNQFSRISVGLQRSNNLAVLDLSSNELCGVVPSWLGSFPLWLLLVSNNLLEGTIPRSLFNMSDVKLMDLSRNKFSGNLPTHFKCDTWCLLFLNNNEFSGVIPETFFGNPEFSGVLNLRNNNLSGMIPRFIGTQNIQYFLLSGNRLTGSIPKDLCNLSNIKMLDLANNRLNGSIPSCLTNMSFGTGEDIGFMGGAGIGANQLELYFGSYLDLPPEFDPDYISDLNYDFEFASKSRYDSYNERSSKYMSGMDLSNNELSGEIPKELGELQRMRALNLSHNSLSGQIPKSFSNLTDTESIDLSHNKLHGPIPYDLSKSHSLAVFNVSYNNLSGSIPSQGQFLTLDESNYIANPLLCGLPVNRSCDNNTSEPEIQSMDGETTIDMENFYWSLAATYSVTWIAFTVFLCFDTSWRRAWFRLVDAFINVFKWV